MSAKKKLKKKQGKRGIEEGETEGGEFGYLLRTILRNAWIF